MIILCNTKITEGKIKSPLPPTVQLQATSLIHSIARYYIRVSFYERQLQVLLSVSHWSLAIWSQWSWLFKIHWCWMALVDCRFQDIQLLSTGQYSQAIKWCKGASAKLQSKMKGTRAVAVSPEEMKREWTEKLFRQVRPSSGKMASTMEINVISAR